MSESLFSLDTGRRDYRYFFKIELSLSREKKKRKKQKTKQNKTKQNKKKMLDGLLACS